MRCHTLTVITFIFIYVAAFFVAASFFTYVACRSAEGGTAAKVFMGTVSFLVLCGLAYFLFKVARPFLL